MIEYALACDSVRIVAATDRRDWTRREIHPLETQIRSAAGTHVPVLISATKPRARAIAGQIHRRSRLSDRELLVIDCSDPASTYEERLWWTGAGSSTSLFLQEVSHMPLWMQLRLRVRLMLDSRARSNGTDASLIGRLLASSSTNLFEAVEEGLFDRDLFYRLNTFHIIA